MFSYFLCLELFFRGRVSLVLPGDHRDGLKLRLKLKSSSSVDVAHDWTKYFARIKLSSKVICHNNDGLFFLLLTRPCLFQRKYIVEVE